MTVASLLTCACSAAMADQTASGAPEDSGSSACAPPLGMPRDVFPRLSRSIAMAWSARSHLGHAAAAARRLYQQPM